jgi:GTP-binding protein Era
MVETATRALPDADVVLFVVDVTQPASAEDMRIAEMILLKGPGAIVLALNKMDLLAAEPLEARTAEYGRLLEPSLAMPISATEGTNCDELLGAVVTYLPPGPRYFPPGQVTTQEERLIVAELIREQILQHLHQEVPHSVAVVVEEFKEREAHNITYISANVFVERSTQKGIIIGSGGRQLRNIGQASRQEIERVLDRRVYLDLWVKVKKKWRKDEAELRRLGYAPPRK